MDELKKKLGVIEVLNEGHIATEQELLKHELERIRDKAIEDLGRLEVEGQVYEHATYFTAAHSIAGSVAKMEKMMELRKTIELLSE